MLIPNITEKTFDFQYELENRTVTDMIVIHHSGVDKDLSAEQIHSAHIAAGYAGIGYHFVIRQSGVIERGRPIWAIGAHAYGENYHTLGVQFSGDFNKKFITDYQLEMGAWLIAYLAEIYDFVIDSQHIAGHCDLMPTDCPGNTLHNMLQIICGKANYYRYTVPAVCPTCNRFL